MSIFDNKNKPFPNQGGAVEAKVILQKCTKNNTFGVRIQKMNGDWYRTWAFKISEKKAGSEGYDKEQISGSLISTDEYPGCPYCGDTGFILCSCGKIGCCHVEGDIYVCPWCGASGTVESASSFNIVGGGY